MVEVELDVEVSCAIAWNGHERHEEPVAEEETEDPDNLRSNACVEIDDGGDEIADGDALEHSDEALMREAQSRVDVDEESESVEQQSAAADFGQQRGRGIA